jgi:hypothetical protein
MRIIKEMDKRHPDYRAARSDLTAIFAKVKIEAAYATANDLKEAFENWCFKYAKPLKESYLPPDEQIKLLGKWFFSKS